MLGCPNLLCPPLDGLLGCWATAMLSSVSAGDRPPLFMLLFVHKDTMHVVINMCVCARVYVHIYKTRLLYLVLQEVLTESRCVVDIGARGTDVTPVVTRHTVQSEDRWGLCPQGRARGRWGVHRLLPLPPGPAQRAWHHSAHRAFIRSSPVYKIVTQMSLGRFKKITDAVYVSFFRCQTCLSPWPFLARKF